MVDVSKIIAYEDGEMDSKEEVIGFFQELIDDGTVWSLQGSYGRTAQALIDAGYCHLPVSNPIESEGDNE